MTFMSNSPRRRAVIAPLKLLLSCEPPLVATSEEGRLALQQIARLLARQAAKEIGAWPVVETPR
jgi:hypothetical protein